MPHTLSLLKYFSKKRYVILILCTAGITGAFALFDQVFTITQVQVISDIPTAQPRGMSDLVGRNLVWLSISDTHALLLTANPDIKDMSLVKKYPRILQLYITYQVPLAQLRVNQGYFLLSADGRIVKKSRSLEPNLPVIAYYQQLNYNSYQSGDTISYKDIKMSLHFLGKSLDLGFKIDSIDINGINMIELVSDKQHIIFTTEKDQAVQDYQLATVVKQFRVEGKNFKTLDLRFDKPIVATNNK